MAAAKIRRRRRAPDLRVHWDALWERIGGDRIAGQEVYENLAFRYDEIHRHYTRLAHIGTCLEAFREFRSLADDPDAVELAIWFHRVVYFSDGERFSVNLPFSAALAMQTLTKNGFDPAHASRVSALILSIDTNVDERGDDETLLADAERSVYYASHERFDEFEALLRREYHWIEDSAWFDFRMAFLQRLLRQSRFYGTPEIQELYGGVARHNILRSLLRLRSGTILC